MARLMSHMLLPNESWLSTEAERCDDECNAPSASVAPLLQNIMHYILWYFKQLAWTPLTIFFSVIMVAVDTILCSYSLKISADLNTVLIGHFWGWTTQMRVADSWLPRHLQEETYTVTKALNLNWSFMLHISTIHK